MNKLTEHQVLYISADALLIMRIKKQHIDYSHLGIILNTRVPLCEFLYTRSKKQRGGKHKLFVDKSTHSSQRKILIDYLIDDIYLPHIQIGKSISSLSAYTQDTLLFVRWADKAKCMFIDDIFSAINAYEQYTMFLRTQIRIGRYKSNRANTLQLASSKLLQAIHNDKESKITGRFSTIKKTYDDNTTARTTEHAQAYSFKFYFNLFNQISDFLLQSKKYPFKLNLPNEDLCVLPYKNSYYVSPSHKKQKIKVFNYSKEKIKTLEEMQKENISLQFAKQYRKKFINNLDINNKKFNTDERLYLGSIALYAYYMHLLAITGMNDSVVASLPIMNEYHIKKERQRYRTIKYRAGNKIIDFEVSHRFIKYFYKYLKLREFILNGNTCDYLFFKDYGQNAHLSKKQTTGAFSSYINDMMILHVDPALPRVTSRQSRVNKTHYNIARHGVLTASKMAQSSLSTIIKHYHGESEDTAGLQLANYFDKLNSGLILKAGKGHNISVGQCKKPNSPKSEINLDSISIACNQSEGCLFCEQYGCHADEVDIRKLYSLQYIINECKYISKNKEHFMSVYKIVLDRINQIITQLKMHTEIDVEQIKYDVFENENLNPYWNNKLAMLIDIGAMR